MIRRLHVIIAVLVIFLLTAGRGIQAARRHRGDDRGMSRQDAAHGDHQHHTASRMKQPRKGSRSEQQHAKTADPERMIRVSAALYAADVEARKVVKYTSTRGESISIIFGVPADRMEEYLREMRSRDFVPHRTTDGTLIGTRKGRMDVVDGGRGVLFTGLTDRRVYIAAGLTVDEPAALAMASKTITGQDADYLVVHFQQKTGEIHMSIAPHLHPPITSSMTKRNIKVRMLEWSQPDSHQKLTDRVVGTFRRVPNWIWVVLLLLFPMLAGMVAISIINTLALRRRAAVVHL